MRRLLILSFLFCLLSLTQSVNAAPNTITKTELDLKLELQKKDIDANKVQTAETKAFIKEELDNQKEYNIDSRKYISDKAEKMNWLMNFYSIFVTVLGIFMALFALYSTLKINKSEKEIKESINKTDKIVNKFEKEINKKLEIFSEKIKEAESERDECYKMKKEIEIIQFDVIEIYNKMKGNADELDEYINRVRENSKKQSLDSKDIIEIPEDKDITKYVDDISKSKTESELTAKDWLLKGYAADQRKDFENACYYYKRASQLDENMLDLYNLWGISLSKLAEQNKDVKLYSEAISKYEKAMELDPKNSSFYNNLGNVLSDLAKEKSDASLYSEAISKYEKAIELDPKNSSFYNNLGNVLSDFAEQKSDAALYNAAISKYEKAIDIDSNYTQAYNNWGTALFNLAELNNDAALYNAAISKYEKAIDIDTNYKYAYNNWGNALIQLSVLQGTLDQNKQRIEELLLKSESIEEGTGSYNFACLYSLLNEKEKAFKWLEKNLKNKENKESRETIEKDKDFDSIKEDPRFKELLNRYYPQ